MVKTPPFQDFRWFVPPMILAAAQRRGGAGYDNVCNFDGTPFLARAQIAAQESSIARLTAGGPSDWDVNNLNREFRRIAACRFSFFLRGVESSLNAGAVGVTVVCEKNRRGKGRPLISRSENDDITLAGSGADVMASFRLLGQVTLAMPCELIWKPDVRLLFPRSPTSLGHCIRMARLLVAARPDRPHGPVGPPNSYCYRRQNGCTRLIAICRM